MQRAVRTERLAADLSLTPVRYPDAAAETSQEASRQRWRRWQEGSMNAAAHFVDELTYPDPSCAVCGAGMQFRCPNCGNTPALSGVASTKPFAVSIVTFVAGFALGALFAVALSCASLPRSLPANAPSDGNRPIANRLAGSVFIHRFPPPKAG